MPEKETRNIKENRFFKSSVWIVLNFACQWRYIVRKVGLELRREIRPRDPEMRFFWVKMRVRL